MTSSHRIPPPLFPGALVVWLLISVGCGAPAPAEDAGVFATLSYVGREVCASCHQAENERWTGSDHHLAMQPATEETVLGAFDGASFVECGVHTTFFREDDRFLIRTQGRSGEIETFTVRYTFGYDPLQQYLIAFPDGRYQAFTVAWDVERRQWFTLYPDECIEPDDWLHWTNEAMNWNYMCADCHSTNVQRNFDLVTNTYHTTYSEINVSCEACHGPGERHVELARSGALASRTPSGPDMAYFAETGLTARVDGLAPAAREIDVCAPCHARRLPVYPDYHPGIAFLDHYQPALLDEDLYYPDGQIRDEVFEYGSFLQSRMYVEGVRCTDCHDPHSTRLKLTGNDLCMQCHLPELNTFEHMRHPANSPGAQCVDCHMPERTYMVVDPRRDHSFKVPRPDLSVELGTPNACTACHPDQSAQWAAARLEEWHGPPRDDLFARTFAGAHRNEAGAEPELRRIVEQAGAADVVRATALSLLGRYASGAQVSREALSDASPLVRATAVRNIGEVDDRDAATLLETLLTDQVRLVRMEAARVLTLLAPERYAATPQTDRAAAYRAALDEYRRGQQALNDQAAAHLNLAVIHESLGELQDAEVAYQTALRLDSTFVPAYLNLAMLYDRQRREAEASGRTGVVNRLFAAAETRLRQAIRHEPQFADAHYTLGLLLAERPDRLADAAEPLLRAADLDSTNARMQYNAGLAHQQLGLAAEAERLLRRAHRIAPEHPDYLNALSIFYAQQEQWWEALHYTDELLRRFPDDAGIQQRRAYVAAQMRE